MELREYLEIGRKWLWLFVLTSTVAVAGAWVATKMTPKTYASQSSVMVGRATKAADPNDMTLFLSQSLASTYAEMVQRRPVLEGVVQALDLGVPWAMLQGMVSARAVPGSQLVEIHVLDTDPARAQLIADETARQLMANGPSPSDKDSLAGRKFLQEQTQTLQANIKAKEQELSEIERDLAIQTGAAAISDLENRRQGIQSQIETWRSQYTEYFNSLEGTDANALWLFEEATPAFQVGPNLRMNLLFAFLVGLGLAVAAALLLEYLDDTVKNAETVERRLGLVSLANIERLDGLRERRDGLVALFKPRSPVAEALRGLRTNLQFSLLRKETPALLITSANPGEGKSTVAANLAIVIAQSGRNVVLVDADLRRPSLHRLFQLPNSLGMTSLLLDDGLSPADALRPIDGVPGLSVLTTGPLPPNPAELLDAPEMDQLLRQLREQAKVVVVDSPPLLVVTDAAVLANKVDGTVLVFDSTATRTDAARKAVDVLDKVGVVPMGVVVNKINPRDARSYYYYGGQRAYEYAAYYGGHDDDDEGAGGTPPTRGPDRRAAPGWVVRLREVMTSFLS